MLWPVEDVRTLNFHCTDVPCLMASCLDMPIRTELERDAAAALAAEGADSEGIASALRKASLVPSVVGVLSTFGDDRPLHLEKVLACQEGEHDEFVVRLQQRSFVTLELPADCNPLIAEMEGAASSWFSQEDAAKLQQAGSHQPTSNGMYAGYAKKQDCHHCREKLELRQTINGGQLFPALEHHESFCTASEAFMQELDEWARGLLRLIAVSLGVHEDAFEAILDDDLEPNQVDGSQDCRHACLHICRYDSEIAGANARLSLTGDRVIGCSEHTDMGLLTLDISSPKSGLQVKCATDSSWYQPEDAFAEDQGGPRLLTVLAGDTLAALSDSHCAVSGHRVLVPKSGERIGLSYLLRARSAAIVEVRPLDPSSNGQGTARVDGSVSEVIANWRRARYAAMT